MMNSAQNGQGEHAAYRLGHHAESLSPLSGAYVVPPQNLSRPGTLANCAGWASALPMIGFYSGAIEPKRRLAASVVPLDVLHGPSPNYNQNANQKRARSPPAGSSTVGTNPGTDENCSRRSDPRTEVLSQIERRERNSAKQGSAQTFGRQEYDSAQIMHFKANTTYSACQLLR